MASNSLVFDILAKEKVSEGMGKARNKISAGMESIKERAGVGGMGIGGAIGAGAAAGLGVGLAQYMDVSSASTKLENQLGLGPAKAAEMSKTASNLFTSAWGDSMGTVNDAVSSVYRNIGDTSGAQGGIEGVTKKAMALSQTFDQEVGGVTAAVGTMMKTGLAKNADEAMDVITRGFQTGADKGGDFLDTLTEYGPQFAKFGLDAKMATGLLSQGLKAGARDSDFVADAIKEFSIKSLEALETIDSKGVAHFTNVGKAFDSLGIDGYKAQKKLGQGGKEATSVLTDVMKGLRAVKDPTEKAQLAVALFGTKAEDLGESLYALDPSTAVQALGQVGGAATTMSKKIEETPSAALEKFKRKAIMTLTELTGGLVMFASGHQTAFLAFAGVIAAVGGAILVVNASIKVVNAGIVAWNGLTIAATAIQKGWNLAMAANPIGLIVAALLLLGVVLVMLWQKNETFRRVVIGGWNAIKTVAMWTVSAIGSHFASKWNKMLALGRAVFGGLNGAARSLRSSFNSAVNGMISKWNSFKAMLSQGKAFLVNTLAAGWRYVARAAAGSLDSIMSKFRAVTDKITSLWNNTVGRIHLPGSITGALSNIPGMASGGIVRSGGLTLVGERGPELLTLPSGAQVTPLGAGSRVAPLLPGGGSQTVVLQIRGDDTATGRFVTSILKNTIRTTYGGNVQFALGSRARK